MPRRGVRTLCSSGGLISAMTKTRPTTKRKEAQTSRPAGCAQPSSNPSKLSGMRLGIAPASSRVRLTQTGTEQLRSELFPVITR